MCTPRALFPRLFLKICFLFFLCIRRLATLTLPYEEVSNLHHYRLETDGKVWSAYIHTVNRIIRPFEVFQYRRRPPSWIFSNRKWRRWIRRPRKPRPRTKRQGDRLTRCRVMAIWNFPKNVWIGPEVGRSSVVNIHTSYTDLIKSSFATLGT